MKVTPEHFEILKSAIAPLDKEEYRERYRNREFFTNTKIKDINKRYRWDLYYMAAQRSENGLPDSTNGYNDGHIYTALKNIVPEL